MISKKHFIYGAIFGVTLLFTAIFTLPDGKLHIVYCNVGQGDAAYIRTPSNQDMLIDGGPNDKVLSCLGKHMPFYDRTIDVVVLSHPQKDHMAGLISVLQRYNVKYFVIGVESGTGEEYKKLIGLIDEKKIPYKNLYAGDGFRLGETEVKVLWPKKEWIASKIARDQSNNFSPEEDQPLAETMKQWNNETMSGSVLGLSTDEDINEFSYYLDINYGKFNALFTGDGDSKIQSEIEKSAELPKMDILKVPHHGSKISLLPDFLDKIKPALSVISVGKNSYGHPTKEAINLLSDRAIRTMRTDLDGEIEVVSDGRSWSRKNN